MNRGKHAGGRSRRGNRRNEDGGGVGETRWVSVSKRGCPWDGNELVPEGSCRKGGGVGGDWATGRGSKRRFRIGWKGAAWKVREWRCGWNGTASAGLAETSVSSVGVLARGWGAGGYGGYTGRRGGGVIVARFIFSRGDLQ